MRRCAKYCVEIAISPSPSREPLPPQKQLTVPIMPHSTSDVPIQVRVALPPPLDTKYVQGITTQHVPILHTSYDLTCPSPTCRLAKGVQFSCDGIFPGILIYILRDADMSPFGGFGHPERSEIWYMMGGGTYCEACAVCGEIW